MNSDAPHIPPGQQSFGSVSLSAGILDIWSWLVGCWSVGRLVGWSVGWLIGCWFGWLVSCLWLSAGRSWVEGLRWTTGNRPIWPLRFHQTAWYHLVESTIRWLGAWVWSGSQNKTCLNVFGKARALSNHPSSVLPPTSCPVLFEVWSPKP